MFSNPSTKLSKIPVFLAKEIAKAPHFILGYVHAFQVGGGGGHLHDLRHPLLPADHPIGEDLGLQL